MNGDTLRLFLESGSKIEGIKWLRGQLRQDDGTNPLQLLTVKQLYECIAYANSKLTERIDHLTSELQDAMDSNRELTEKWDSERSMHHNALRDVNQLRDERDRATEQVAEIMRISAEIIGDLSNRRR